MRILHLSDIHSDKNNIEGTKLLIKKLTSALDKIQKESPVDLVVFSGDAINRGGISCDNVSSAFKIFEIHVVTPILDTLSLDKSRIIIGIGNHDIERNAIDEFTEEGLTSKLKNEEDVSNVILSKPQMANRCKAFKNFESNFYQDAIDESNKRLTPFASSFKIEINGKTIGITSLNSAWRCSDSNTDHNKNIIGTQQIIDSLALISDCDIKIAVSHHHYSALQEFDGEEMEKFILANYDMLFCGHTHSPEAEFLIKPIGSTFNFVSSGILSANINNTNSKYKNGFNLIDYDVDNGICAISYYRQNPSLDFILNSEIGENGKWQVPFPLGEEAEKRRSLQRILFNIRDKSNDLNEHLLSYNTPSKSPKNISDIFVMPQLKQLEYSGDSEPDKVVKERDIDNLQDIIGSKENIIIFGAKESGKTILLDKIQLDLLQGQCRESIPVRLDFKSLKKIQTSIEEYWQKDSQEVTQIIDETPIILLVDNIIFSPKYYYKIKALTKYLKEHDNIRLIGTCRQRISNDLYLAYDDQEAFPFARIAIEQFQGAQVRELAMKWIPQSISTAQREEKTEVVINALSTLNIPRTPFAVSMFLWILERQEEYRPQNQALLLEGFIEEILKKGEKQFSRRDIFDFRNKISLLASMALRMFEVGGINYALKTSEAIAFIEDYLEVLNMDTLFNAKSILNDLLESSILIEDVNIIKFRFSCFFEYFLAKKMEEDSKFKDFVLSEEQYLNFYNEICYYTGLHRNENNILKDIVSRLEYDYIDINDLISNNINSIDEYFNVDTGLFDKLTADDLFNVLPEKETEEEKIQRANRKLSSRKSKEGEIQEKKTGQFAKFARLLLLAMNVLKNSEEVKEEGLKQYSYNVVLKNSISYALLYKLMCEDLLARNKVINERIFTIQFSIRFLPLLHEIMLSDNLGSYKLSDIIKGKIEEDVQEETTSVSEFEKFLSVFLYADVKGPGYWEIVQNFIKRHKRSYITDTIYLKIMSYYHSSTEKNLDNKLLSLLGDLYIQSHATEYQTGKFDKGKIIQHLKNEREKVLNRIHSPKRLK
jgi:possible phosphohydrolase